jgi:sugar-specific transcriptional regulator TrmB
MLQDLEDSKVLVKLGLTLSQAQIYLALAKTGKVTIKTLSATVRMDRANVFRVIERLQELNLVEKLLTSPTTYQSVNLHDVLPTLLAQKQKEYSEVRVETKDLLKRYRKSTIDSSSSEIEYQLVLVSKGSSLIRKVKEMTAHVEKNHEVIIYWSDFKSKVDDTVERWALMLNKGVSIKALVFLEEDEVLPSEVTGLSKNSLFKIRYANSPIRSTIAICDGREALVSISPKLSSGAPSLWVNNPHIVALIQDYFEMLWENSN